MNKQSTTRILIMAIAILLFMAMIDFLVPGIYGTKYIGGYSLLIIAERVALLVLIINGTLIHSSKFKIVLLGLGVTILATLMKILHLQGADEVFLAADAFILLTYVVHFYLKPQKALLDILKLICVILLFVPTTVRAFDLTYAYYLSLLAQVVTGITFLLFLFNQRGSYRKNYSA